MAIALAWLAYGAFAAPFAFAQASQRFSSPAFARRTTDEHITVESRYDAKTAARFSTTKITIQRGDTLCVPRNRFAFGLPGRRLALRIDNIVHPLRYGIPRTDPANIFQDDALRNIGFDGCVSTAGLAEGSHDARLIVIARDFTPLIWPSILKILVTAHR